MAVPILLIVSTITFALVLAIPGDPASRIAGDHATPEQIQASLGGALVVRNASRPSRANIAESE